MKQPYRRNALSLIIVLAVMALIGSVVAGLTYHAGTMHEQLRNQRLQATARYCAQSAESLIGKDAGVVRSDGEPLNLEMDSLMASGIKGKGVIQCVTIDNAPSCEIDIHVQLSQRSYLLRKPVTPPSQP